MHKYLRAVGFSMFEKKREIDQLIEKLVKEAEAVNQLQVEEDANLCEIRALVTPGMGLAVVGEMSSEGVFNQEYYYPYLESDEMTSDADCSIQRHTEKETFSGLLDEYRVGISLIFYLTNSMEYRRRCVEKLETDVDSVNLSALSVSGKILLPIQKSETQKKKERVASNDRNNLIEAAKNGDEDAMETLTIEDIDLYSQISRRMIKEDIYSIIDSCFMPCGIECDQYSIIGEIRNTELKKNRFTEEEIYDLIVECNDLTFHVGINKKDLVGEPEQGRRFKGQIWMLGSVNFKS